MSAQESVGAAKPPAAKAAKTDEDFARELAAEEEAGARGGSNPSKASSGSVSCQKCNASVAVDAIYILDECTHKFCQPCIRTYVHDKIQVAVNIVCPNAGCNKELSVRDMKVTVSVDRPHVSKELLPKTVSGKTQPPSSFTPKAGSAKATERIMQVWSVFGLSCTDKYVHM